MGYKGVRVHRAGLQRLPHAGREHPRGEATGLGQGFGQMMDALELGRVNVAARGVGIAQRALELALRYSQSGARSASRSPNTRRFRSPSWLNRLGSTRF